MLKRVLYNIIVHNTNYGWPSNSQETTNIEMKKATWYYSHACIAKYPFKHS